MALPDDPAVDELQSGHLSANLPKAFGRGGIIGHLRRAYYLLLNKILSSDTLDQWGTGQVDDRLGTLLRADGGQLQDTDESRGDASVIPPKIRRHKAGVQGVGDDACTSQPSR